MKAEKQIESMAGLDGIKNVKSCNELYGLKEKDPWYEGFKDESMCDVPDYLHDHNAVQRVIDDMSKEVLDRYWHTLCKITVRNGNATQNAVKATPAQKVETILKATGKWEEV